MIPTHIEKRKEGLMRRTLTWFAGMGLLVSASAAVAGPARYVPAAEGFPFSKAVAVDGVLYLSGEIGTGPDGKLVQGFDAQVRQTMDNIVATLAGEGLTTDDVFKCTVYLADMSQWGAFNRIYLSYFKPGRLPARSALGVNGLAMGAVTEVECWASLHPK